MNLDPAQRQQQRQQAAASILSSSHMGPRMALPRVLLLLFLHLLLLGCRSHPLGGAGLASELPGIQVSPDELLRLGWLGGRGQQQLTGPHLLFQEGSNLLWELVIRG